MLAKIARVAAQHFGDRSVVVSPEGNLSYSELDEYASRLSIALRGRGVGEGDVVALVLPSGGDWLVAATAVSRLGAIFAGVSPILTPRERGELQSLVSPRLTLTDSDLVDGLSLRSEIAIIPKGTRGQTLNLEPDPQRDEAAIGFEVEAPGLLPADEDRPAVICFTSGTTGRAKAALYRERQLNAIQRMDLGEGFEQIWGGGAPMLASTQFAHVGMSTKFPWYLRLGSTLHVMERWRADEALRLVASERMPTIGAVAPQLALMLRSPLMDELDLSCVQTVVAGGASSPVPLVRAIRERLGAGYSIRYSSTETGGVGLATDARSDDESEWGTVGTPRPLVEVRIADESDNELSRGMTGELQLRSPAVMDGYWNDPKATLAALTDDRWLRTGDLASIDENGRVVLCGRQSDMYIRGGYNVFPSEVEAILLEHPLVDDVVVVPQPDEVMGERGLAMVVPADRDRLPTLDDLRTHAATQLSSHKLPESILIIAEVPLTSAQKIDRMAALKLADQMLEATTNVDAGGPHREVAVNLTSRAAD
ncbi:MAG TPA: class I adenylate-forming enzyme family protein [Microthrixaceae bacterium]|nr:class I adenylate-forming enzyme family protein [Microthrixaceae bacterium]